MKKTLFFAALSSILAFSSITLAKENRGGFQGDGAPAAQTAPRGGGFANNAKPVTVAEAQNQADDTWVVLTGRIVKQLGHEKYQFTDGTTSITIEIDDDVWQGLTVGPNDKVEIQGEVDKGFRNVEIDVKRITKK